MGEFGIGNRVKQRKIELNLTVEEISARTPSKMPATTINNIIYGKVGNPQIDILVDLSIALEMSLDELVLGKRAMKPDEMTAALNTYINTSNESHAREIAAIRESCTATLAARDAKMETKQTEIDLLKDSHGKEIKALDRSHKAIVILLGILLGIALLAAVAFGALYFRYLLWDMSNLNEGFIKYMQSGIRGLLG